MADYSVFFIDVYATMLVGLLMLAIGETACYA
ncbi:unnamed protein product [Mycetohabitans rhizoxinica HKI 454]|uniref:Uncharacterized protein n=1 Tax=Mycetohabitans rhizoxinica (strain DSM 19002 / CIP 109453 / HKI 454) TaxID=882378 RepID=E5ARU8_MYCRK|nr:unnamed protein product [Mycetohabitans rhizoxinica HKI 454]